MRIQSIHIRNFKGLAKGDLSNCSNFNVLIGKNNSGKSTILQAIDMFFSHLSDGYASAYYPRTSNRLEELFSQRNTASIIDIGLQFDLTDELNGELRRQIKQETTGVELSVDSLLNHHVLTAIVSLAHVKASSCIRFTRLIGLGKVDMSAPTLGIDGVTLFEMDKAVATESADNQSQITITEAEIGDLKELIADRDRTLQYLLGERSLGTLRYRGRPAEKYLSEAILKASSLDELKELLTAQQTSLETKVTALIAAPTAGTTSNYFYETMLRVQPGDIVFSFVDQQLTTIGRVLGVAKETNKPNFGRIVNSWSDNGWLVPVDYHPLKNQIRPKSFISEIAPLLPSKYSPLSRSGDGFQHVYLASLSNELAALILQKIGAEGLAFIKGGSGSAEDNAEEMLRGRTDIGDTQRSQLILARRGQGVFRTNVSRNERACRVTGVTQPELLVASHIKPWRVSNDTEKLDGTNGLLLSPHVDRLFDRGLISFADDGTVLFSKGLDFDVRHRWRLNESPNVGRFSAPQAVFLAYHRQVVFRR